ncbi:MAG: hypothetical protein BRD52_03175 [Bacteroidetes bacterium SW_4_67_19]|nr:MAG: hypothetical protein BRD52_03175 [Bacteroidetes bacterium SW_4_67_19]
MTLSSLDDLFAEQLKDLHNSEDQIQNAYERWAGQAQSGDLKGMFEKHRRQSQGRKSDIEDICEDLGISPAGHKCQGTEGLIAEGNEFLEESADGAVRDAGLIANAQRIEHYGIAGYGCAATTPKPPACEDDSPQTTDLRFSCCGRFPFEQPPVGSKSAGGFFETWREQRKRCELNDRRQRSIVRRPPRGTAHLKLYFKSGQW